MELGDLRLLARPTVRQQSARTALSAEVAKALIRTEDASDAVSALLSVACAYLRLAEPSLRVQMALDAAILLIDDAKRSLS